RILMFIGQNFTTATNAGFLLKLSSLTVIPFAYFMLGEKIKKRVIIAFLIMIFGVFLLTTNGALTTPKVGDILIIILATLLGFTNSLAKEIMKGVDSNIISSLRLIIGNFLLLCFITPLLGFEAFTPLFGDALWVFVAGILGYIYILSLYKGIELVGASKATIFFLLSAVFTAFFAFIFLREVLSYIQLIGGFMILGGAYIIAKK
ncbi:MAG: DMT family transporter, partial [Spirochaetaceae bacterium]|nr:DMT family transporter [Spirochaetaceae bacterium]